MKRLIIMSSILLAVGCLPLSAQAFTCKRVTAVTTLSPQNITVQRDLPVGSVIGTQITSANVSTFSCTNSDPKLSYQQVGVKAYGSYAGTYDGRRVYSTNIPGVGYAIGGVSVSTCNGGQYWVDGSNNGDGNVNNRLLCSVNGMFGTQPITMKGLVTFYKTANVTGSGTVSARNVGAFIMRTNQNSWFSPESDINISSFNVTTLACTVNTSAISVPMGNVNKRDFSGVGSWPGNANTKNFTIPLTCNAGTRVNVRIDGNVNDAAKGVININSAKDGASGVGIQLLHSNNPLMLGVPFFSGENLTQGKYDIPFQARYYQTGSVITPGAANASATFTLTYQ